MNKLMKRICNLLIRNIKNNYWLFKNLKNKASRRLLNRLHKIYPKNSNKNKILVMKILLIGSIQIYISIKQSKNNKIFNRN